MQSSGPADGHTQITSRHHFIKSALCHLNVIESVGKFFDDRVSGGGGGDEKFCLGKYFENFFRDFEHRRIIMRCFAGSRSRKQADDRCARLKFGSGGAGASLRKFVEERVADEGGFKIVSAKIFFFER